MLSHNNNILSISESDRQDTIMCKCTLDQLKCAIKKVEDDGINEESIGSTPDPKNNWKDVVEYNEKIGYTSIVVNDEDRLQIAKVSFGSMNILIIKHIGNRINRQCNLRMSQEEFLETLSGLV